MAVFKKLTVTPLFAQYGNKISQAEKDLLFIIEDLLTSLGVVLNGGLTLADNFDGEELTVTSDVTPDTEFSVTHALGRIPTRFHVTSIDEGGVVYKGPTAWTDTTVYFKCTTGGSAVKVVVY